jgi:hypothetical protein
LAGVFCILLSSICSAESKDVEYVDDTGCALANGDHFNSIGTLELGKRFAESLLKVESAKK